MEDSQIIQLYNMRNARAIDETHAKYGRLCYRIADGILHRREDCEECVNDAYMAVWNSIPPQNPAHFSAFLCGIVRNLALKRYEHDHARKRNRDVDVPLDELESAIPDRTRDALEQLEEKELAAAVSSFLRTVSADDRNIFLQRYWFFRKVRDIASDFSCSQSRVKSSLFRTRNKLAEFLCGRYSTEV
ncbi:MAG: sigma-70 family RNA polymerase sigma factor [Clostridia bacterium]|nr:sigma-70 family RNA polymerase sigma factor [Clostridia bacterium]